jgi:muskelin
VTQLHKSLVLQGDWSRSEKLLDVLSSSGLFDGYLQSCQPHAMWTRLLGTDADGDVPPARGGHAMCIDPVNEMIYIFGGWNGEKSMDDFWVYNIKEDKWRVLSHSTSKEQNAPGARSCHKMVFDTKTGSIYVLGRLNDADGLRAPAPSNIRLRPTARAPQQQPQQQEPPTTTSTSEETTSPKTSCSEFYRYHTRGVDTGKWDFLAFDTAVSPDGNKC